MHGGSGARPAMGPCISQRLGRGILYRLRLNALSSVSVDRNPYFCLMAIHVFGQQTAESRDVIVVLAAQETHFPIGLARRNIWSC